MPVVLLDRIPLPSLRTYTAVSVVLLACAIYYAHNCALSEVYTNVTLESSTLPEDGLGSTGNSTEEAAIIKQPTDHNKTFTTEEYLDEIMIILVEEAWCVWTLINMAYCCLILLGKFVQKIVFGELRVSEKQHVRDKFWNFVFYKFIFVFGVLNVQEIGDVVCWCAWFSVLCLLHLLAQLSKDRFEYLSFSPTTPAWNHFKVVSLLVLIQSTAVSLLFLCAYIGLYYTGVHTFAFMAAECFLLMIKTLYVLVRYAIHLWDIHHEGVWENRTSYVYHAELIFELSALSVDFIHHLHMLIWGNILLSMASLVISMQLRYLFHEFQKRIRRHKNYLRVVQSMEAKFLMATKDDLDNNNDDCAICWEKMESARKLPCGHLFHNACLRSWLEQDTSCPTCRGSLSDLQPSAATPTDAPPRVPGAPPPGLLVPPPGDTPPPGNRMTNHFFHFDGSRYVSWLPSFSVEVSHTQILGAQGLRPPPAHTSLLDNMARQVREVFPHMPMSVILEDLHMTRSVEITIDNIIQGRLATPPGFADREESDSDDSLSSSDSQPSTYSGRSSSNLNPDLSSMQLPPVNVDVSSNRATIDFRSDSVPPPEAASLSECMDHPEETTPIAGGRFSKSSSERESILAQRKAALLQQAQRNFMSRQARGKVTMQPASSPHHDLFSMEAMDPVSEERELRYRAAQRRLNQSDLHNQ